MTKLFGGITALIPALFVLLAAEPPVLRLDSVPESKILHRVQPAYSPEAMDARVQGMVKVSIVIGTDGKVQLARLVSGHPLLAPATLQAVRQWTFEPFQSSKGKPIRVMTEVEIPYSLPPSSGLSR
jgi:TonB family protein